MKTRVEFTYDQIDVIATAYVLSSGLVTRLNLYYPELDETDYPTSKKLVDDIKETAEILLLEENSTPEVTFYDSNN